MITYQQNGLLERQVALLDEQNKLLQRAISVSNYGGSEVYVENIDHDEMRDDFLVTSGRKKMWNVQIALIKEFDRICKKHNLRWFAVGGTLIGAARHKGFIPWDDDVDVALLRPDYEKFRKIVESEIKPPYYLDMWYNYYLENEKPSELTDDSLQPLSINHYQKHPLAAPFFPMIKIRDKRTLFLGRPGEKFIQSIFMDIFPLDSLPPFAKKQQRLNFEKAKILFIATVHPDIIKSTLEKNQSLVVDEDTLREFMSLPYKQRGIKLEEFLSENFFMSEHIGDLRGWCIRQDQRFYQLEDFQDIIYLPFEKIRIPCPVGYDNILTNFYGDWRTPVKERPHATIFSAEISWEEYLKKQQ